MDSSSNKRILTSALKKGQRLDFREIYQMRAFKIQCGRQPGTCLVKLGRTTVYASISAELTEPSAARPDEGIIFFSFPRPEAWELGLVSRSGGNLGHCRRVQVELLRILERSIRQSEAVDLGTLCVIPGQKVWVLRLSLSLINFDGNIVDAASYAALGALTHFKLPHVPSDEELSLITSPTTATLLLESGSTETSVNTILNGAEEGGGSGLVGASDGGRRRTRLTLFHYPICVSFAFFDGGAYLVLDPSAEEEAASDGKLILSMNAHRELCAVSLSGKNLRISKEQILRYCDVVAARGKSLVEAIKRAVGDDIGSLLIANEERGHEKQEAFEKNNFIRLFSPEEPFFCSNEDDERGGVHVEGIESIAEEEEEGEGDGSADHPPNEVPPTKKQRKSAPREEVSRPQAAPLISSKSSALGQKGAGNAWGVLESSSSDNESNEEDA